MKKSVAVSGAAVLALLACGMAAAQDSCNDLFEGMNKDVRNRYGIKTVDALRSTMSTYVNMSLEKLEAESKSGKTGANLVLKILSFGLGGGGSHEEKTTRLKQLRTFFASASSSDFESYASFNLNFDLVDKTAVNAWLKCMETSRVGVHGRLRAQGGSGSLTLVYKNAPGTSGTDARAKITSVSLDNCKFVGKAIKKRVRLDAGVTVKEIVKKIDPKKLARVVVNTDKGAFEAIF